MATIKILSFYNYLAMNNPVQLLYGLDICDYGDKEGCNHDLEVYNTLFTHFHETFASFSHFIDLHVIVFSRNESIENHP
jgi:hypothetical protein